ncbi:hypothetical protein C9413_25405 [Rhizobium sp. SEMIA 4085]|uniref:hypothetical protein n=1 Tax=Rhizobium TaxID=379 RepID=UPI000B2DDCC8|nr:MULTISPECIES: hypothetical protein [Rhizobium]NNH32662.1 hypothetical protein [Rhizobium sp. SEMIA 4085]
MTTTWLTQRHDDVADPRRLFVEYIDEASQAYGDALVHDGLDDPAKAGFRHTPS